MAESKSLLTNANTCSGTKVNFDGNLVTLTIGNSMSVSAGMTNAAYLGAKTLLISGVSTNITLGVTTNFTFGNVISASYGASWNINNSNNTSYDLITRFGVSQNVFAGGVSDREYLKRWTEDQAVYGLRQMVIVAYLASVGLALFGMQYPPFTMTGKDSDGYATGVDFDDTNDTQDANDVGAIATFILDGIGILALAYAAYSVAQKFWNMKDFNPVAYMTLDTAGINCEVYAKPDGFQVLLDPGQERPNAPPITATNGSKAGFYLRPSAGTESPPPPIEPNDTLFNRWFPSKRRVFVPDNPLKAVPEIELLTTAVPDPTIGSIATGFSQIYMTSKAISIGTSMKSVPDVITSSGPDISKRSNASLRPAVCGPLIELLNADATTGAKPSIKIRSSMPDPVTNIPPFTITMDSLQTEIKRISGTITLAAGVPGADSYLKLDTDVTTGIGIATLGSLVSSIGINTEGEITIACAGVPLATFTKVNVEFKVGTNSISFVPAAINFTSLQNDIA